MSILLSQNVYPSAYYLLFVNFDFFSEMDRISEEATDEPSWFFSAKL